jgi:hypothetical protein
MAGVSKALHTQHRFTIANSPWSNGTIEVVCREVLRALRALVSEFQMEFIQWPTAVPMLQYILNHSASDRLGGLAPITAMTLLPATTPLLSIVSATPETSPRTISQIHAEQISEVAKLRSALDGLHRTLAQTSGAKRDSRRQARNRKLSHASHPNFSEGDFVLVAVLDGVIANKLSAHWRGPRRIIAVESEWVYHVQDLLTKAVTVVHSSRMKFYDDASLDVSEELLQHVAFQQSGYEVSSLRDVRRSISNSRFEVLVSWRGFDTAEDTWEPLSSLAADVPQLLHRFLERHKHSDIARQARASLY